MAGRAAQLAIELTEDGSSKVAGGLDDVTAAAKRMGDTVEAAGRQADKGASGMDRTTESADEMASKGSQAAGAMAGLGDLIGGPFGNAMMIGGTGLQAMADSGDLLNAALDNSIVTTIRAKAATVAKTAADKAGAAATKVMTVAQKALNLAQRASPIGLIITGVLLLAGLFIVLYKRSDTFRKIVDKAMSVAKAGVSKVGAAFSSLGSVVGKVMAFIGRIVSLYVKVYVTAFTLVYKGAKAAWGFIQDAVGRVVGWIIGKAGDLKGKLADAWDNIKDKGKAAFDALTAPIQTIIDLVQGLIDKIKGIHFPKVPDLNPFNRSTAPASSPMAGAAGVGGTSIVMTVNVTASPGVTSTQANAQAQQMMDAIDNRLRSIGRKPVFRR